MQCRKAALGWISCDESEEPRETDKRCGERIAAPRERINFRGRMRETERNVARERECATASSILKRVKDRRVASTEKKVSHRL